MVWDYKKASCPCIKKALQIVNWDVLPHLKSVHEHLGWMILLKTKLNKKIKHSSYTKEIIKRKEDFKQ